MTGRRCHPSTIPAALPGGPLTLLTADEHDLAIWTLDPDVWLGQAEGFVGRNMTRRWAQYGPRDEPFRPTLPHLPVVP